MATNSSETSHSCCALGLVHGTVHGTVQGLPRDAREVPEEEEDENTSPRCTLVSLRLMRSNVVTQLSSLSQQAGPGEESFSASTSTCPCPWGGISQVAMLETTQKTALMAQVTGKC